MDIKTESFSQVAFFLAVLFVLIWGSSDLYAQSFQVSGTVVAAGTNEPLPSVNIVEVGTQNGTSTDKKGEFTLAVSSKNTQLSFSFIGYKTRKIKLNGRSSVTVKLTQQQNELSETVVTAFGIEKQDRTVGYSVGKVSEESLTRVPSTSLANNLSGKIAGVHISRPQGGPSSASRIVIRGISSLGGNNQPLVVVDGVPLNNRATVSPAGQYGGRSGSDVFNSIDPNDIETFQVLKGPSAAALYGSRAQNGVIVITTKSGRENESFQATIKSGVTFDKILTPYDFQQEYGVGSRGKIPTSQQEALQNGTSSWGAQINGQEYVGFDGKKHTYTAHPDNLEHFYQTGSNIQNYVGFSGGDSKSTFHLSLQNLKNNGIIPTNSEYQNNINFQGKHQFGKVTAAAKANYIFTKNKLRPYLADSPANPALALSYAPTTLDVRQLRDYQTDDGNPIPWNNNVFRLNPYWAIHKIRNQDTKRRLNGFFKVNYDPYKWLDLQVRATTDYYNLRESDYVARNTLYKVDGNVHNNIANVLEENINLLATFQRQLSSSISLNAHLGANRRYQKNESANQNGNNIIIPGLYNIGNTDTNQQSISDGITHKKVNSVFGSAQIGYNDYLFLEVTGRNDWSSTLPAENNSYFYPSVNASFIFTDALHLQSDVLTFGKIRASYAQVGGDTSPYRLSQTYKINGSHITKSGSGSVPFGGISSATIPLKNLKPTKTKAYEMGLKLGFFNSRATLDFTYYNRSTTNQILATSVSDASGYSGKVVNAGEIRNDGIEVDFSAYPVQTNNFSWNLSLNFAKNNNQVVSLTKGNNTFTLGTGRSGNVNIQAITGKAFNEIVGTAYLRNSKGQILYDDKGLPMTQDNQILGNATPDWTGGISNQFNYKNVSLYALLDISAGGNIYSLTNAQAYQQGEQKATLNGRESFYNDPANGGVVGAGVKSDSTTANNIAVDPQIYYNRIGGDIAEPFVYDASYIKFRELSLTYTLPTHLFVQTPIKNASVSLIAHNLAILLKNTPNIDPESNYQTSSYQGLEHASLPSTRSFGFNVTIKF